AAAAPAPPTSCAAGAPPLARAAALLAIGIVSARIDWVEPSGAPIQVRLVQGNIPLSEKFDPEEIFRTMDRQRVLAESPRAAGPADLTLLPETAVPVFQDQLTPEAWQDWTGSAQRAGSTFVLGVALRQSRPDRDYYYNGVIALDAHTPPDELVAGTVAQRYSKRHLVPFGEFVPPGFRWFVDAMVMPLGDFDRGAPRQQPFDIAGQHVAPNVCYEDVFGEELLPAVRPTASAPGATILANVSNLAWFGDSLALPQHLQMSRMRVRETERPMLRATNTGMTAVIDAQARVAAVLPPLTEGVLDAAVQGTRGLTPYARTGNAPVLALLAVLLAWGAWRRRPRHGGADVARGS
ncbi:apolipoprotein N-acyltransferase, partial [Pigmentiphaga soli]|uniref:apolipoprotein N-acyltransferase n=1 Tax=Pigmentiphaga soli TaxID=1007095 RepID=UPI0031EDC9D5